MGVKRKPPNPLTMFLRTYSPRTKALQLKNCLYAFTDDQLPQLTFMSPLSIVPFTPALLQWVVKGIYHQSLLTMHSHAEAGHLEGCQVLLGLHHDWLEVKHHCLLPCVGPQTSCSGGIDLKGMGCRCASLPHIPSPVVVTGVCLYAGYEHSMFPPSNCHLSSKAA
jgi:hypothetical protein